MAELTSPLTVLPVMSQAVLPLTLACWVPEFVCVLFSPCVLGPPLIGPEAEELVEPVTPEDTVPEFSWPLLTPGP